MPITGHAYFVPGRQALNIGWKVVLANDRYAHTKYGLHQQAVRAGGPGTVYRGNFDDDVVYCCHLYPLGPGAGRWQCLLIGKFVFCIGNKNRRLMHIPGSGRATLGAKAAMNTKIFILNHYPSGMRKVG